MLELDDEAIESNWDEDILDGESDLDEAEFLLDFLSPGKSLVQGVSQLFKPPARPPAPTVSVTPSTGVNNAVVQTPRGQASIQLPTSLVSKDEFNNAVTRLQSTINADSARINTLQKDLETLGTRVGAVVGDTQQAITKSRTEAQRELRKLRREARSALRRVRTDQQQAQTMSMMMGFLMQQQLSDRLSGHVHGTGGAVTAADGDDDSMMLMMLPMMMMGQPSGGGGGGGGDNSMMPMMMMAIAMSQGGGK